ncbi:SGNH/GDSL hydrolase family protein [Peribacillus frigoritolerans]|uniref:SGNH/GDSL hydrolase family protein n=1 Tax=Peribacillus castrilensis TaxID=2897690 RepID=A0AAW9NDT7_9BACI|nr:SGNH/GDSL hydrolase family protein [Peribacillus castrilensis]MEC0300831.1 SGNH/GDSL hydrolase family protein [Peribacillus castrilensis]MEC0344237.1 SGNH/GDSL hydrolase family protein [Peribacillus castrilensis]
MRYKITCLFICLVWISGCSQNETASNQPSVQQKSIVELSKKETIPASFFPDPVKIVSIGDSLTQGVGDSKDNGGYLPYLQNKLEKEPSITSVEMINHGIRGNRTDQLLKRLDKTRIKEDIKQADSIVVTIGGNDIMKVFKQNFSNLELNQFDSAKIGYEKRLRQILDKVRSENDSAQIYLVGVYNPFSKWLGDFYELDMIMNDWNESGKEIIEEYDSAYFIEIADIFENPEEDLLYTEDYFHPNDRGYELIATRIYNDMDITTIGKDTLEASAKGDDDQE